MAVKKPLQPNDFPVQAEDKKIVKKDGQPTPTLRTKTAEDIADRLNNDAWRREEDNWSA